MLFRSINKNIKIINTNHKYYFNIYDLSKSLNYHNSKYLYNYYFVKCKDIKIYNNEYAETSDIIKILSRSRKQDANKLLDEILEFVNSTNNGSHNNVSNKNDYNVNINICYK